MPRKSPPSSAALLGAMTTLAAQLSKLLSEPPKASEHEPLQLNEGELDAALLAIGESIILAIRLALAGPNGLSPWQLLAKLDTILSRTNGGRTLELVGEPIDLEAFRFFFYEIGMVATDRLAEMQLSGEQKPGAHDDFTTLVEGLADHMRAIVLGGELAQHPRERLKPKPKAPLNERMRHALCFALGRDQNRERRLVELARAILES